MLYGVLGCCSCGSPPAPEVVVDPEVVANASVAATGLPKKESTLLEQAVDSCGFSFFKGRELCGLPVRDVRCIADYFRGVNGEAEDVITFSAQPEAILHRIYGLYKAGCDVSAFNIDPVFLASLQKILGKLENSPEAIRGVKGMLSPQGQKLLDREGGLSERMMLALFFISFSYEIVHKDALEKSDQQDVTRQVQVREVSSAITQSFIKQADCAIEVSQMYKLDGSKKNFNDKVKRVKTLICSNRSKEKSFDDVVYVMETLSEFYKQLAVEELNNSPKNYQKIIHLFNRAITILDKSTNSLDSLVSLINDNGSVKLEIVGREEVGKKQVHHKLPDQDVFVSRRAALLLRIFPEDTTGDTADENLAFCLLIDFNPSPFVLNDEGELKISNSARRGAVPIVNNLKTRIIFICQEDVVLASKCRDPSLFSNKTKVAATKVVTKMTS